MDAWHPVKGDSATIMLNKARARAEKRYQKTLERMQMQTNGAIYRGIYRGEAPLFRQRERLRKWRDLWLAQLRHERDQLLMGKHPRQFEFYHEPGIYRGGNRPAKALSRRTEEVSRCQPERSTHELE